MQLTAFTYDEAEKNAGNSYTPFAIGSMANMTREEGKDEGL